MRNPRHKPFMIYLTDDQKKQIERSARDSGEHVSAYIRRVALEQSKRHLKNYREDVEK
jgi:hypothetical protein